MPGRFIGHRGARDSEWSWEQTDDSGGRGYGRGPFLTALFTSAFVGGLAAIAFGLFLILSNGNGDAAPPLSTANTVAPTDVAASTPEPTAVATPTPQTTETAAPTVAPTAAPAVRFRAQLRAWSDITSEWALTALDQGISNYREDDLVPVLLRIDNATLGDTYDLQLTYDCASRDASAIDFLGGVSSEETSSLLAAPGPKRVTPDSALIVPDDPSLDFDNGPGSAFRAWGATFSAAHGPTPQSACTEQKTIDLSVIAQSETMFIVWTMHLSSPAEWGDGNSATDAVPFSLYVEINDVLELQVTLLPGAISQ